jgi:hypothetical protein
MIYTRLSIVVHAGYLLAVEEVEEEKSKRVQNIGQARMSGHPRNSVLRP